jgi:tetraacyldisaccharide 4'-kinase
MTLIEGLYYIGYLIKKHHALKNQKRLPYKVISIGNITVGGTGKTPATIAFAEEAKRRGFIPNILTRGYKGKISGPCFVSRGDGPLLSEEEAGDEPILMAERLKGVPIIKCADRYKGGVFALQNLEDLGTRKPGDSEVTLFTDLPIHRFTHSPIVFILDDGFQHQSLFRNKDILLIDGTNPFGNRKLLPLGPLREPLSAMSRADIIVITKTDYSVESQEPGVLPTQPSPSRREGKGGGVRSQKSIVNDLIKEIRQHNVRAPIFFAKDRPSKFVTLQGNTFPLEWAKGKRFFGFAGIGNPESFKSTLLSTGVDLKGFKSFRDHYRYSLRDIKKIIKDLIKGDDNWIVTTEKDIMRLRQLNIPANLVALSIEFTVDEDFYNKSF